MRVVLTSHGSTGDIFPMIALGVELRKAGHEAAFATSPPFRGDIERAGIEFIEIPPKWSQAELAHWMGRLQRYSNPLFQLRELYRAASPHIGEIVDAMDHALEGTDMLVSSYLFPMNRAIAERRDVPFATFAFAHNTVPSRYYPPEGCPRLRRFPRPIQHMWNRWLWRIGNVAVDTLINQTIARQLRARNLPLVKDFFSKPANLVLVAVSPGLMKPPFPVHRRFRFTGYCRWQASECAEREAEVLQFTQGERVPVLTFGSMVYDDAAAWMRRFAAAWPKDRKILVQQGWAGFEAPPGCPQIKSVGPMCHDQLFRHASVVIHHGGAGTTASVLHAGCPQVIVPHIGDQNFFAHEVMRLGCGKKMRKATWPEKLARVVSRVARDSGMSEAATRAAAALKKENGPATAVREIECFTRTTTRENGRNSRPRRAVPKRVLSDPENRVNAL